MASRLPELSCGRVPNLVNVQEYAAARAHEMHALAKLSAVSAGSKLVFQKLPKHMRRRVMSHNARRLPRSQREPHLAQLRKAGMPPQQKRPSRRFRRRPSNLMLDYERRHRLHKWLETHIWHAKRFHMVSRWGFRLGDRPCDKAFRACYRATAQHCLLQDMSYYGAVEVAGPEARLVEGFRQLSQPGGLSVAAKAFRSGRREGSALIYHSGRYPYGLIGEVSFVWESLPPSTTPTEETHRRVWLWTHPAFFAECLAELRSVFGEVRDLQQELCRFRLVGPLAQAVVSRALKAPHPNNATPWLQAAVAASEGLLQEQSSTWQRFTQQASAGAFPPHVVYHLTVIDPRMQIPQKRTKARSQQQSTAPPPPSAFPGFIWSDEIRAQVSASRPRCMSTFGGKLVPDFSDAAASGFALPLMLLQQPGVKRAQDQGYAAGWDLVFPRGWGVAVWLSLVMWGARAGGLRDANRLQLERSDRPQFYPGSEAATAEEEFTKRDRIDKYFRLPPKNRVNYAKNGICAPFDCPWKTLLDNWTNSSSAGDAGVKGVYAVTERAQLEALNIDLSRLNPHPNCPSDCLIPVKLTAVKKGSPKKFAIICLPEDKKDFLGKTMEPIHRDEKRRERNVLRKRHATLLKQMKRRRQKERKAARKELTTSEALTEAFKAKMRQLWLPDRPADVRRSCRREIMGFVTEGSFAFRKACGMAVGFVTGAAVQKLLASRFNRVLVRNTSSRHYQVYKMDVIVD